MIATRIRPWHRIRITTSLPRTAALTLTQQQHQHQLQGRQQQQQVARMSSSSQPPQTQTHTQTKTQTNEDKPIYFGPFEVTNQVFLKTAHSFALVNLKPLLPGHVLVCPLRPHRRLTELGAGELADLFAAVQRVQRMLARKYFVSEPSSSSAGEGESQSQEKEEKEEERGSFNIAVQDGPEAGQTVPHVHVHVIPRIRGATAKPAETPSDAVYEQMAGEEGNVGGALWDRARGGQDGNGVEDDAVMRERPRPGGSFPSIEDAARRARSMEEMEAEAGEYRRVLQAMEQEDGEEEEEEEEKGGVKR